MITKEWLESSVLTIAVLVVCFETQTTGSQITNLNECKSRCSLPVPGKYRRWCRIKCPLRSLQLRSPAPGFNRRITSASKNGIAFKPKPTWTKITKGVSSTAGLIPTTTTRKTSKVSTIESTQSSVTVANKKTTTRTRQRFDLRSTSEGVTIMKNISNQNFYFKLAGILLGVCFVIFVACCVWRSVKKPHRVSFIDGPVIVVHTSSECVK